MPRLDFDGGRRRVVVTTPTQVTQDCPLYRIEDLPQLVGDSMRNSLREANFIVDASSSQENVTVSLMQVHVACPPSGFLNRIEISYEAVLSSSANPRLARAHGQQERLRKVFGPGDLDKAFGEVIALAVEDMSARLLDRQVLGAL
jgi:hypothetical protein